MNNYEFLAAWASERANGTSAKVLDYGCGAGRIVEILRTRGIEAFGCDAWYGGGDASGEVPESVRPFVSGMERGHAPYPDATFDLLVSNMVLEHVEDFDATAAELARLMKPGGMALHLFPDRSTWREGHAGIPFLHWFPKHSTPRVYYALALRTLGLGNFKAGKPPLAWSRDFCGWVDEWTFYRKLPEIHAVFRKYFRSIEHIEERWFEARFGLKIPARLERLIVRKSGGVAIVLYR